MAPKISMWDHLKQNIGPHLLGQNHIAAPHGLEYQVSITGHRMEQNIRTAPGKNIRPTLSQVKQGENTWPASQKTRGVSGEIIRPASGENIRAASGENFGAALFTCHWGRAKGCITWERRPCQYQGNIVTPKRKITWGQQYLGHNTIATLPDGARSGQNRIESQRAAHAN